jgi:hypothetical protein
MAEYFDQVNPLIIHRSAAIDVDPLDRAVADANDERAFGRHGYRRRRDEERRPRPPRGPDHFGKHSLGERSIDRNQTTWNWKPSQGLVPINVSLAETARRKRSVPGINIGASLRAVL